MSSKRKVVLNNNHIHHCDSPSVGFDQSMGSIADCDYSLVQLKAILDFYLTHTPIKSDEKKSTNGQPVRHLSDYNWKGSSDLTKLERSLLSSSGIPSFVMLKSDSIEGTIQSMQLGNPLCIQHPRAVMSINKKISIREDGKVAIEATETRLACLFRHIRNSIAHGRNHLFSSGNLLLEDGDGERITARILIPQDALVKWIALVDQDGAFYPELKQQGAIQRQSSSHNSGDDK